MATLMETTQDMAMAQPAHWGGVFATSLCVFALIASEFMPVSLLTPIADALQVSEGLAGRGIAISGALAVLTSLFISALSGTMNRKTLLVALTGLMALSGGVVGLAPNYVTYMIGAPFLAWSLAASGPCRRQPPCGWSRLLRCRALWPFSMAVTRWQRSSPRPPVAI